MADRNCAFCGEPIPSVGKKYLNTRNYCSTKCRLDFWRSAKFKIDKSKAKKYDPKEAAESWERILAKRDPVTHRYTSEDLVKVKP